jgi:GTP-binding protein
MQPVFPIVSPPDDAEREVGRLLFAQQTEFLKGVVAMDGLPDADRTEVCFAGRSNVGKSSLINALTGRKGLARASNTPGRTQEINYFTLTDRFYLVDLPGYGFANAPVKIVEKWQRLLKAYLTGRQTLRRAFVLVDARRGVKAPDEEIMKLLDQAAVTFQVVLTKIDKLKAPEIDQVVDQVRAALAKHPAAFPGLILTSSEKGDGLETLRAVISQID